MRTILCYGDSNTWGAAPMTSLGDVRRFAPAERWPGVLRHDLGAGWWVVEEGLNGRTTAQDDPVEGAHKNGRSYLLPCLETHAPIDLFVVMLGTNDLKHRFGWSAYDIASGAGLLLDMVLASGAGPGGAAPRCLLVCPPALARLGFLADMFQGATAKSQAMPQHYRAAAAARGTAFLDAGTVIRSSDVDGIHLDADQQAGLGRAIAGQVRALFPA